MITKDTAIRAGAGFLLGAFAEAGIEAASALVDLNIDIPDYSLAAFGSVVGLDKDMCDLIDRQIKRRFKKSWSELSEDEWAQFSKEKPTTADYLKEALKI